MFKCIWPFCHFSCLDVRNLPKLCSAERSWWLFLLFSNKRSDVLFQISGWSLTGSLFCACIHFIKPLWHGCSWHMGGISASGEAEEVGFVTFPHHFHHCLRNVQQIVDTHMKVMQQQSFLILSLDVKMLANPTVFTESNVESKQKQQSLTLCCLRLFSNN